MHTHPLHVALFLHLAGFLCGLALYGMLLGLAMRGARLPRQAAVADLRVTWAAGIDENNWVHVCAGIAGVLWNAGALIVYVAPDIADGWYPLAPAVVAYSALGFLPAVAAHSALRPALGRPAARLLVWVAYAASAGAALLNARSALSGGPLPAAEAMRLLTVGFAVFLVPMVLVARRQLLWRHAMLILALAVFAVTAVHMVDHRDFNRPFWFQVLGHHASVPLAVAILVQDYPFAFSDLLLKRILSLAGLVGLGLCGVLAIVSSPLADVMRVDPDRPVVLGSLLLLVVGVALAYQAIRAHASTFVDRVILRRAGADTVLVTIGRLASQSEHEAELIAESGRTLAAGLTSMALAWQAVDDGHAADHPLVARALSIRERSAGLQTVAVDADSRTAAVVVPTTNAPRHVAVLGPLPGGRPFLSADVSLLRDASLVIAHRIDAIRMGHERFEQELRGQETARLAADAELRALRAQINPHFLFNALTTIGYLVPIAPDQATRTLLRLTELLRRVLRADDEVVTVATELQLVEAYLEIERARFEERLQVSIDVPEELRRVPIPSFVLQPLVENAVKHGVATRREGGTVSVTARLAPGGHPPKLEITVADSGAGARAALAADGAGIGLANVRRRLELAYGPDAVVTFEPLADGGARTVVVLPVTPAVAAAGERRRSSRDGEQR